MLAVESERAESKISELESAMKRLTHMDRACEERCGAPSVARPAPTSPDTLDRPDVP